MGEPLFTFRFTPLVVGVLGLEEARARTLVEECGLPEAALEGPCTAPLRSICQLLDRAVLLADDPNLGLRVGSAAPAGMFGLSEMVVRTAPTVDDAMHVAARFYHLINPVGRLTYASAPRHRLEYHVVGGEHGHVLNELAFAYLLRGLNLELDEPVSFEEAWFSHERPTEPLEAHFGCPVRMGTPTTGVIIAPKSARAPLRSADPVVHAFLLEQAASTTAADEPIRAMLVRVIEDQLGVSEATLESVADAIGWSRRTLQRRLREEGLTFHEVIDTVRRRRALALIASGVPRAEVARRIGLANAGSLRRALARWERAHED